MDKSNNDEVSSNSGKNHTKALNTQVGHVDNVSPRTKREFAAYEALGFRYPGEDGTNLSHSNSQEK